MNSNYNPYPYQPVPSTMEFPGYTTTPPTAPNTFAGYQPQIGLGAQPLASRNSCMTNYMEFPGYEQPMVAGGQNGFSGYAPMASAPCPQANFVGYQVQAVMPAPYYQPFSPAFPQTLYYTNSTFVPVFNPLEVVSEETEPCEDPRVQELKDRRNLLISHLTTYQQEIDQLQNAIDTQMKTVQMTKNAAFELEIAVQLSQSQVALELARKSYDEYNEQIRYIDIQLTTFQTR